MRSKKSGLFLLVLEQKKRISRLHISGKKGILISDEKRNMLAAANKKKTEKKHGFCKLVLAIP